MTQGTKSSCAWLTLSGRAWRLLPGWGQLFGRTTRELIASKAPGGQKSAKNQGHSDWGANDGRQDFRNVGAKLKGRSKTVDRGDRKVSSLSIKSFFFFLDKEALLIFVGRRGKEPAGVSEATTD